MGDVREPIWLTEAEAISLIDLGEAITATHKVFVEQAAQRAVNMPKTQTRIEGSTLHATGGAVVDGGYAATKAWTHTPAGAMPMLLLWSLETGTLLAVIEAHALGQYRTASVSAVATSSLAAVEASQAALLGAGAQALIQVAAVNAVRPLDHVTVWSRREESRRAMVKQIEDALQLNASAAASPAEAVADAEIITTVTRATEPFLGAADVPRGAHVNAIGAISLDRAEFAADLLERCLVVADDVAAAQASSNELRAYFDNGSGPRWESVRSLSSVVAAGSGRPDGSDVTLLKAMGAGIADLGVSRFIYEQALENGLGLPLPLPTRSRPRLRASAQLAGIGYV